MDIQNLLITLGIGAVAGWLAGLILKGGGFGLIGNIVVGVLGAFIGGFLFKTLGISVGSGLAAVLVSSVVGAVILLFVIGLIKR